MRIAFILPSLENKGPIVFTQYLIQGLKDKVDYIQVFYFKKSEAINLEVPVMQINLLEKINFEEYDIVHTTGAKPDLYGWINRKYLTQKWVVSMHNLYKEDLSHLYHPLKAKFLSFIWGIALKSANNIIVSSKEMENYYRKEIGSKNYNLIPYGIKRKSTNSLSKQETSKLNSLKDKYFIIGSVGLLIKRKGFHQLIDVLVNNKNYAVVIIGNGEEEKNLNAIAKEKGVLDRFILLGFKHNSLDYYKYFDIYATTSYSEGFGLAMLEAMSQEIAIVCSNLQIYNGYFNEDNIGLFETDNKESLEKTILKVSNNLDKYKKNAYKLYENNFSLEVMALKHFDFYYNLKNKI